jgi:protocatechuate 3,4-dioxygenase beta subunit
MKTHLEDARQNPGTPSDDHDHHRGLAGDLTRLRQALVERRQVLRWAVGASLIPLVGCGTDGVTGDGGTDAGSTETGTDAAAGGTCTTIPEETAGPYPGDGSNGPNVLTQTGIVRSDIRTSFGGLSGTAAGVPLTVTLALVNSNGGCAALSGYAVYLWHCDQNGMYSLYGASVTDQNYLRGVQATDSDGKASFTTIFPACYSGRWPHIHFEIYSSLDVATAAGSKLATSQLALPQATCEEVYATAGYAASVTNLQRVTLASDLVFSDGWSTQVPSITGSAGAGYTASLTVPVAA